MTELLTAAQMRAIEREAIDSGEVTGLELMERAGRGVVEAIFEEWPELAKSDHRAVVLCGPGNNGGDGFVVARRLRDIGWEVALFLFGDPGKLPPDAGKMHEIWCSMGEVGKMSSECLVGLEKPDVIIDAVFGIGISRPLPGIVRDVFQSLLRHRSIWTKEPQTRKPWAAIKRVAIDVPSGLCADLGQAYIEPEDVDEEYENEVRLGWPRFMSVTFLADLTITFHISKVGHHLALGPNCCTKVRTFDLEGLRDASEIVPGLPGSTERVRLLEPVLYGRKFSPARFLGRVFKESGHKYTHGHAVIMCGGLGKGGAARLAARGALRIGAGLVTLGCPPEALAENAAQLNAIMVRAIGGAEALAEVLKDARINALCLGPGLGVDERAAGLLAAALASPSHPSPAGEGSRDGVGGALPLSGSERGEGRGAPALVLDADALTILGGDAGLFAALHEDCVLTPHAGEFARLFPDIAEKLNSPASTGPAYSKVDAARAAARRAGCVVLFKGPDTVIADADGRCSINSAHYGRAAPWLATAGSGDVLAGFIVGLLARGFAPMQAAETGAWLHVECAISFGPGLIAEDLCEQLPAVFRDLGI